MSQTPPLLVEESRDPMKCAPGERVLMKHVCPFCESDLDLRDRVSWIRDCPGCPYLWVPPKVA